MPNIGSNASNPVVLVTSFSIEARVAVRLLIMSSLEMVSPLSPHLNCQGMLSCRPLIINSCKPPVFSSKTTQQHKVHGEETILATGTIRILQNFTLSKIRSSDEVREFVTPLLFISLR